MAESLLGTWKQVSAENYEQLLDALGVPKEIKEVFVSSLAELEISKDGDTWSLKSNVKGKTRADTFKLGEERDSTSITGRPVKLTVTLDGNTLVETASSPEGDMITRRCVQGGQLVSEYSAGGGKIKATIKFDKA